MSIAVSKQINQKLNNDPRDIKPEYALVRANTVYQEQEI